MALKETAKEKAKRLKEKLKESLNTAIVAAFGFLIALVWKDVITEYVNTLVAYSPVQGKLISALIITFMGVIGILIITSLLAKKE